jgi:ribosome-associated protein
MSAPAGFSHAPRRCSIARSTARVASPARSKERRPADEQVASKENPQAKELAIEAARALADDKCHQVTILNVAGVSPVTDFFVIATGTSARQMRSAADSAEKLAAARGYRKLSRSGDDSAAWIILDCFDVVVHVFTQEARSYYDIDGMWGDAKRVEWERTIGKSE